MERGSEDSPGPHPQHAVPGVLRPSGSFSGVGVTEWLRLGASTSTRSFVACSARRLRSVPAQPAGGERRFVNGWGASSVGVTRRRVTRWLRLGASTSTRSFVACSARRLRSVPAQPAGVVNGWGASSVGVVQRGRVTRGLRLGASLRSVPAQRAGGDRGLVNGWGAASVGVTRRRRGDSAASGYQVASTRRLASLGAGSTSGRGVSAGS